MSELGKFFRGLAEFAGVGAIIALSAHDVADDGAAWLQTLALVFVCIMFGATCAVLVISYKKDK